MASQNAYNLKTATSYAPLNGPQYTEKDRFLASSLKELQKGYPHDEFKKNPSVSSMGFLNKVSDIVNGTELRELQKKANKEHDNEVYETNAKVHGFFGGSMYFLIVIGFVLATAASFIVPSLTRPDNALATSDWIIFGVFLSFTLVSMILYYWFGQKKSNFTKFTEEGAEKVLKEKIGNYNFKNPPLTKESFQEFLRTHGVSGEMELLKNFASLEKSKIIEKMGGEERIFNENWWNKKHNEIKEKGFEHETFLMKRGH
jgi:hypothetical protein